MAVAPACERLLGVLTIHDPVPSRRTGREIACAVASAGCLVHFGRLTALSADLGVPGRTRGSHLNDARSVFRRCGGTQIEGQAIMFAPSEGCGETRP